MADTLRICVLFGSERMRVWQANALQSLLASEHVVVTLTVVNEDSPQQSLSETVRRGIELREWGVVAGALSAYRRITGPLSHEEQVPIDDLSAIETAPSVHCKPVSVDGWKQELPTEVVDEITASADVVLRFGFGVLVGSVLTAT